MSGKVVRSLPIVSSRGCPHRCAFCFHVLADDNLYRWKDPKQTIREIKDLKKKYRINNILFCEDNLLVNRKRVKTLMRMMIDENLDLSWKSGCRANYFRDGLIDDELLSLMKKAGCISFSIGAEHGSQRMLDIMKKDITPAQILASARACNKFGFHVSYGFIFGVPGETRKDLRKTVSLIKKIRKVCPKAFGGGGLFRPYPGGELYSIAMREGRIEKPKVLRDWAKRRFLRLMTTQSEIPWTKDVSYTKKMNFYCNYYFFSDEKLRSYMKVNKMLGAFFALFVYGVRARFALNFFSLPVDKFIFEKSLKMMDYEF